MKTVRAKCPNCWETDDCEIVETTSWYANKEGAGGPQPGKEAAGGGHNLKCPTCQNVFWHEIRAGGQAT
jgi:phage FluMu protein Com